MHWRDMTYISLEEANAESLDDRLFLDAPASEVRRHYEARYPRSGYIYLLKGRGCYKIGRTKDVPTRMRQFGLTLPFKTELIHYFRAQEMVYTEKFLHDHFADVHINGEWFNLSDEDVEWFRTLRTKT